MSTPTELVRVIRSGFHECSHYGALVVTDSDGSVLHQVGPVDDPMFPRSSSKPFQAIAMLAAGAQLTGGDLAISAASHSGEQMHLDRVRAMLDRIGLTEDDLGCPPALPLGEGAKRDALAHGGHEYRITMNCSGKHAGMLSACLAAGWDTRTYLDPNHPLQQSVASIITELSGETPSAVAVDGCGAPLYAISLAGLARAFGRIPSAAEGTHARTVADAMRGFPEMVGGTGREDTRLMTEIPGLLVKGGAEGVHCASLPDGRTVAVKIADGGDRARMPALVAGLRFLGLDAPILDELGTGVIKGGGVPVGTVEVAPGVFPGVFPATSA